MNLVHKFQSRKDVSSSKVKMCLEVSIMSLRQQLCPLSPAVSLELLCRVNISNVVDLA